MSDHWPNASERQDETPLDRDSLGPRGGEKPRPLDPSRLPSPSASTTLSWNDADQRLLAIDSQGNGLAVALWRHGDRYAHALYALSGSTSPNTQDGSATTPLLLMASCEGNDRESWPASPPLQQLIVEPREAGREVALLIGMAGSSHWSLSIDVDPIDRVIVFEAACRCSSQPTELGSRYQIRPSNRMANRELQWHLPHVAQVELLWPDSRGQCQELHPGQTQWTVRPGRMPSGKWPATIQWNYAARWL
jgi:hypothetical protein